MTRRREPPGPRFGPHGRMLCRGCGCNPDGETCPNCGTEPLPRDLEVMAWREVWEAELAKVRP